MTSYASWCRVLAAAAVLAATGRAEACAACGCGDPTLVAAGTEQPFVGRLRASLEARYRTDSIGQPGVSELELREERADLGVAWAPLARLFLMAGVPIVHRTVTHPSLARDRAFGLGDAEVRAKVFLYRDRPLAARLLVAATAGLKLPTAPLMKDSSGAALPLEAQPGAGSLDVLLAPSVALFRGWFSAYASVQASVPVHTRWALEPGPSLRPTLALQAGLHDWLALRAVGEARVEGPSHEEGRREPDSGGAVVFVGGDALVSPVTDLTLAAGARVPVVQALRGFHREGPALVAAVAFDF